MMELMEPVTYLLDPECIDLKNADKWKNGLGILDFLASTKDQLKELEKVSCLLSEIRRLQVQEERNACCFRFSRNGIFI